MVDETETISGPLEDLRAFCAVVEFGTVSAAARQLNETKGSVSRRISRLERRLGTALLARTPRAVTATEEGIAFYAKARDALSLLADAVEGARESCSVPQGHLRVTAPVDFGMDVLPNLIVQFRALHPQISVELLLTDTALDLAAHRIDLALRASASTLPDMGYRASGLIDFHIGLYAASGYLASRGIPSAPTDITNHELVGMREFIGATTLSLTHRSGRSAQVVARPVIRTSDYASVHRIVLAGGGIGAIPDIIVAPSVASGAIERVLADWTVADVRLHAISLGGREAPARVRLFRDFMRAELAAALRLTKEGNTARKTTHN
ncbi:MAG: LysR family transcriptional regulator [Nitrococcus mobilis]|nr:LysR family transcriptional regulator [Nitrococcus mobilis]